MLPVAVDDDCRKTVNNQIYVTDTDSTIKYNIYAFYGIICQVDSVFR